MTNLSRTSEDSLRHPPEHPPVMKGCVGTQSPSSAGFRVGFGLWVSVSFQSVDLMVGSKMMLFTLLCLLSTVKLSHSDPGYSMNGTVYYTEG